jgi:integrase
MTTRGPRAYGTGAIYVKHGAYYGRWVTAEGGRANRRLGPVRPPGGQDGLTVKEAEARLRELINEVRHVSNPSRTVADAGRALLEHLEAVGRSKSHRETAESHLRVHIEPAIGRIPIDRLDDERITRMVARMRRAGKAPKTIRNVLSTLHSVCDLAVRRRWCPSNPCRFVDAPAQQADADIRYLSRGDLERLLRDGVPSDEWGSLERTLYLTAAMTGLRQGELIGLRWRDVDWLGQRIRVRQAYVRGEFKAPKSRRGVRAVPLAIRVAGELERHSRKSSFADDDDLVFANPATGVPLDRSKVRKRFVAACRRAGVREVRFHDLRHTFGTHIAASGKTSMRTLQEWMGHRDSKTTLIYADYLPDPHEADIVERAFGRPDA